MLSSTTTMKDEPNKHKNNCFSINVTKRTLYVYADEPEEKEAVKLIIFYFWKIFLITFDL